MCNQMEMSDIIPVLFINIMGDEWHKLVVRFFAR